MPESTVILGDNLELNLVFSILNLIASRLFDAWSITMELNVLLAKVCVSIGVYYRIAVGNDSRSVTLSPGSRLVGREVARDLLLSTL